MSHCEGRNLALRANDGDILAMMPIVSVAFRDIQAVSSEVGYGDSPLTLNVSFTTVKVGNIIVIYVVV